MSPHVARVVSGTTGVGQARPAIAPVIQAAGALVWRVNKHGEFQVRVIHRPRYQDWSWPKGKVDTGEALPVTAVREVAEETGRPIVLGVPLPGLQYLLPDDTVKRVHYWAAQQITGPAPYVDARLPVRPVDPTEVDRRTWMSVAEAREKLSRKADRAPLEALAAEHAAGRLATRTLMIVRHGRALPRAEWFAEDADRPMTPNGHGQAHALVPVLAAFGVDRLVSSPWLRCMTTLTPYAQASGLEIEPLEALTESGHHSAPAEVPRAIGRLLAEPGNIAVCTHRPVLATVIKAVRAHCRDSVAPALPHRSPYLQPGEALAVHVSTASGKTPLVVGVERLRPRLA